MKLSNVLVCGGSGFIGTRLMKNHSNWTNIDLKEGEDVCDGIYGEYDVIVLLAARLDHTKEDYQANLDIYAALGEYLVTTDKQPHVIYTSSAAVYEDSDVRHEEHARIAPGTIYGQSKLLGEHVVATLADSWTILRLANVFGDGQGNGAIDRFIQGKKTIYGDGMQVRDYVHVSVVANAIEKIIENTTKYDKNVFNISTGSGQTVNEIFKRYGTGEAEYIEPRDFDVPYSVLSNVSAMEEGLL